MDVKNALSLFSRAAVFLEVSKPCVILLTNRHNHLGQKLSCPFQVGKLGRRWREATCGEPAGEVPAGRVSWRF